MARKKYVGEETLEALLELMKTELAGKASTEDIEGLDELLEKAEDLKALLGEEGKVAKAGDAEKLGGKDADAYVTTESLTESLEKYLNTDDIVSAISDLEELDDEDRKVAAAALVNEVLEQLTALEATVSGISGKVTTVEGKMDTVKGKVSDLEDKMGDVEDVQSSIDAAIKSAVTDKLGEADGIATLGNDGKVPADQLPSYVDDVIDGYMVDENAANVENENYTPSYKFYVVKEGGNVDAPFSTTDTTNFEELTSPERGVIYVDMATSMSYRWSGSKYVEISSGMVEMTEEDVQAIWDKVISEDD